MKRLLLAVLATAAFSAYGQTQGGTSTQKNHSAGTLNKPETYQRQLPSSTDSSSGSSSSGSSSTKYNKNDPNLKSDSGSSSSMRHDQTKDFKDIQRKTQEQSKNK